MVRLDFRAARKKYGQLEPSSEWPSKKQKAKLSFSTKYFSSLSCLHDSNRQKPWVAQLKDLLNDKNDL